MNPKLARHLGTALAAIPDEDMGNRVVISQAMSAAVYKYVEEVLRHELFIQMQSSNEALRSANETIKKERLDHKERSRLARIAERNAVRKLESDLDICHHKIADLDFIHATVEKQAIMLRRLEKRLLELSLKAKNPAPRWYIPEHTRRAIV